VFDTNSRRPDHYRRRHGTAQAPYAWRARQTAHGLAAVYELLAGWIKYIEYFYPEYLPNLSTCKSPQQMFARLPRTYWAKKIGKKPEDIYGCRMPCTAKNSDAAPK